MNQFSGDIPTGIRELVRLSILFLGRNNFNQAPVPVWLWELGQLTELSLKGSSLNGTIPTWLGEGELSNLLFLDLGENELSGTIPQTLNSLSKLTVLILNSNRLKGELGLGELAKLGNNTLFGTLPFCGS
jgi:Leucine-rich repeat (LRR) protein